MKKVYPKKKSAFSLIELSIVLIIIGLLIAGVTGGASLIKSSELRSAMGEARGYAVATSSFYSQFNAYQGDFNIAMSSATAGDGDGYIEYATGEGTQAWPALKAIGAIEETITGLGANADGALGTNLPRSKLGNAGWAFDNVASSYNVVVLTGDPAAATSSVNGLSSGTGVAATGALTPTDALAIDAKIDDGIANAGEVRAIRGTCFSTTTYTVATTTVECALSFSVQI